MFLVVPFQTVPMLKQGSSDAEKSRQNALYQEAVLGFGAAIERLSRGYEADHARGKDLIQEIHVALWRSFAMFDERCSLRTWVYRVANNVGASHVLRSRRSRSSSLVSLSEAEGMPSAESTEETVEHRDALGRLTKLIQALAPVDRQVFLLYLDGIEAQEIADITGLSASNVATKIHRIKKVLASRFSGDSHE